MLPTVKMSGVKDYSGNNNTSSTFGRYRLTIQLFTGHKV